MGWLLLKNMAMVPEGRSFPRGSENKPLCWLLDLSPPWFLPCVLHLFLLIYWFSFISHSLIVSDHPGQQAGHCCLFSIGDLNLSIVKRNAHGAPVAAFWSPWAEPSMAM